MLIHIIHETKQEHRRLAIAGVVLMVSTALLIGLSIAIYMKVFTPVTMVTIKAENAGQQLARYGDVRRHGVLVGQVRSISQDSKEASIKVALQPDAAKVIPNNSQSRSSRPLCSGRSSFRSMMLTILPPRPCVMGM